MTGLSIWTDSGHAQTRPPLAGQGQNPAPAEPDQQLINVRLGSLSGYSRLVFYFEKPMASYSIERIDADTLSLDFGPARSVHLGPVKIADAMVEGVFGDSKRQGPDGGGQDQALPL